MAKRTVTKRTQNVGVNALARECNLPQSTVSSMMRRGMTADQIRARAGRRTEAQPPKPPTIPGEYDLVIQTKERIDALEDAKLRRARALAERQEIENALRRGELMPVSYVRKFAFRFLTDGRDEMLRLPSELADALAAETDPREVTAILRAAMERVLAKFEQLNEIWQGQSDQEQAA
jgi:hypothetical protein